MLESRLLLCQWTCIQKEISIQCSHTSVSTANITGDFRRRCLPDRAVINQRAEVKFRSAALCRTSPLEESAAL